MLIIVIIISGLLLAAIIIRPFWGLLLLWPVLLCYPHAIMKDLLPLNVGFDDLFVTFVFVAVVTRCVASGQLRFGRWGLLVSTFWLIYMSSNVFGMIYTNIEEAMVFVAKDTIKQISVLMIALAVLNGIQEANQIRRLVRWFLIGTIGLSVIAILQFFYPGAVAAFYQLEEVAAGATIRRATGTTAGAWALGGVLGVSITVSLALLTIVRGVLSRPLPLISLILGLVAIILSNSRAGWVFLVAGAFTVFVLGKRPVAAFVIVAIFAGFMVLFPFLTERVMARIQATGGAGYLGESATVRIMIWKLMLSNLEIVPVFIGLGGLGTYIHYGSTPHNYYLAVLVQSGIIGVLYFILLGISLWRRTWSNIRLTENSTFMMALWKGIFSLNVGVMAYSLTSDTLNAEVVSKVLFFFWTFLYLGDYIYLGKWGEEVSYESASYDYTGM